MGMIFELSGAKFEPDVAADLWPKIMKHKWLLSEKVGRDVGLRIACIDFLENMDKALEEYVNYKKNGILHEMGARTISRETKYCSYVPPIISGSLMPPCFVLEGSIASFR